MITDHVYRPFKYGNRNWSGPRACAFMNCVKPRVLHARSVSWCAS